MKREKRADRMSRGKSGFCRAGGCVSLRQLSDDVEVIERKSLATPVAADRATAPLGCGAAAMTLAYSSVK